MKKFLIKFCAIWGVSAPLCAGSVYSSKIRVDASGNTYAIWLYSVDSDSTAIVQAAIAPAGGAWATTTLSSTTSLFATPNFEINAEGDMVVMWLNSTNQYNIITRSALTSHWSSVTTLTTPGAALPNTNISINATGQAVVIWQAYTDDSQSNISSYTSSSTIATGAWSPAAKLSP